MLKKYLAQYLHLIYLTLAGLTLSLSAHAGYLPPPASPFPAAQSPFSTNSMNQPRQLAYFTHLVISGNIDVNIKTGLRQSQIIVTGDPQDLPHIQVKEENDTLIIWPDSGYPQCGIAHVEIYTQFLNNLVVKNYKGHLQALNLNTPYFNTNLDNDGSILLSGKIGLHRLVAGGKGTTQIHGINSQSVYIVMKDNPTIDLTGVANVKSIKTAGSGNVRLYWVDSDSLTIIENGKTYVDLAGIANKIYLELHDNARFNGRYLRAKDGYVKTFDRSIAEVQFLNAQSVLANEDSTISFYGKPPYKANFMGMNGAVLDMEDH